MAGNAGCEYCSYYIYDEDSEEYVCDAQMDEDDYARLLQGRQDSGCPFFSDNNEYRIVRHQM